MLRSHKSTKLYIVVFGESQVGKTCFIDMFIEGEHFIRYNPMSPTASSRDITFPSTSTPTSTSQTYSIAPQDISPAQFDMMPEPPWPSFFKQYFSRADGIILMYDITCKASYERVIRDMYAQVWSYRKEVDDEEIRKRFGCVLVGNKADLVTGEGKGRKREVDKEMAEEWAESQGFKAGEITSNDRGEVESVMEMLVESVLRARRMDMLDAEERKNGEKTSSLRDTLRRFTYKTPTNTITLT